MSFSVSGRAAVATFLAGPLNLEQEARLIQANDFVQSEIRWDNAQGSLKVPKMEFFIKAQFEV